MGKPQFLATEAGEIVIMSRADYDELLRRAGPSEDEEDAGTARLVDAGLARLGAGEPVLPQEVVVRLDAENPIVVLREWRGMTQHALAEAAGIGQSDLADLERGRRAGSAEMLARIAQRLGVPLDSLA